MDYQLLEVENGKPLKMWTEGVPVEEDARRQLMNTAKMPFIFGHLAVMPDVHLGKGSTNEAANFACRMPEGKFPPQPM